VVTSSAKDAAVEGASLRILEVRKDFPAPDNANVRTQALDGVTLSVVAG